MIIPVYNCEKYIEETIESVLNQTYGNIEIILVDDCSTDNSLKIMQRYVSDKVKLIELKHNQGKALAFNKGLDYINGQYLGLIDGDDIWFSDKLEKQIKFMIDKNYDFTFTSYQQVSHDKKIRYKVIKSIKEVTYYRMLLYCPIAYSTVILNIGKLGKRSLPNLKKRQDYALWLEILKEGYFAHGLPEVLAQYRIRPDSISRNKVNLIKWNWKVYREFENLSILKSFMYLNTSIISKLLRIK